MLKGACILDFDRFWICSLPYQVDMVYANSILPGIWYMQIQYFQPMVLEMLLTEICDFQSLASCQSHNTGRSKGNLIQGRTILRKSS